MNSPRSEWTVIRARVAAAVSKEISVDGLKGFGAAVSRGSATGAPGTLLWPPIRTIASLVWTGLTKMPAR